jgi:hemerythrin-like domain-containing protein
VTTRNTTTTRRNGSSARAGSRAVRTRLPQRDAIALLKDDHRTVEKLFKAFERSGEKAYRTKRKLVDEMIRELSVHAAIEEQIFYPAVRQEVPGTDADVLEALEEHHVAKWILSELEGMDPKAERFDAKVTVLLESVRHHVKEEEHELFPEVRSNIARKELIELGARLAASKRVAPTRPHPRSPDEPPGNLVVGAVAGAIDRARAAVKPK